MCEVELDVKWVHWSDMFLLTVRSNGRELVTRRYASRQGVLLVVLICVDQCGFIDKGNILIP